jgi:hypothetical protein
VPPSTTSTPIDPGTTMPTGGASFLPGSR